ncbi:MAG: hypothetical protein L6R39_001915 [Caloplaca ligustica]|nr:MAG: hypothetical protein L6R39_001915 [Caloplaca ligustica]
MGSVAAAPSPIGLSSRSTPSPKHANLNVQHVVLGDLLFRTWYPSYYPEEIAGRDIDRLYLFSQNLSLFAKFFLDNKSVFFDVASFNYYLLVYNAPNGTLSDQQPQIIGFFSKEKMSWDNNNLACILVFPPWQRKGLGKILMGISYELSRLEGRIGGPEKPLSELGRIGYLKFWQARVANVILRAKNKTTMSAEEVAEACWMLAEDVISALKEMDVLGTKRKNDGSLVVSKARVREWVQRHEMDLAAPVDEEGFADGYVVEEDYWKRH